MPLNTKRRFLISLQLGNQFILLGAANLRLAQRHVWRKAARLSSVAEHQIAFTSGQSRARPSCKPSASWFLLAHGAENLPGLFRAPRASALEDLERQAMDRVGKSTPMSNGPAATPY